MSFPLSRKLLATTASLALLSGPAFADVSAQDVWDNWRAALQEYGYALTATEEASGSALVIKDLVMSMDIPEDEASVSVSMEELTFTENGDGTVNIAVPQNMPLNFSVSDGGEDVEAKVTVSHDGMTTVASGTKDEMTYTYGASSITASLDTLVVNGETISDIDASGAIGSLSGTQTLAMGDTISGMQQMSADSMSLMVKGNDPESGDLIDMSVSFADIQASSDSAWPKGAIASSDPSAMFVEGMKVVGSVTMQSMALAAAFEDEEGPGQINMTTGAGGLDLDFTDAMIAYGGKITEVAASVMAPDVPLPIDVTFGELGYDMAIPLKASEAEQDFKLGLNFTDIGLSDFIWNLFDANSVLPRDAATLVLGLSGKATVFQDLVTLDEDMDEAPGEVNAVSLDVLELKAAGADISGTGSFTFDNSDLASFDGFPRPEGAIDVKLNGINGLMDKLIQMGLLPEEQAMPARMMMGMFTVPVGDDQLTSRIEVNDQGHVLANGQRLK